MASPRANKKESSRIDIGRFIARIACIAFALIGGIPLTGGLVIRSQPLRAWAADETSRLIREQLGVDATFDAELSLIPLRLAVYDLNVPSNDGGAAALSTRLASVSPRFFSLLAGRIDVGDIELQDSHVRLVMEAGKVVNAPFKINGTDSSNDSPQIQRSPFRSLAVTNLSLDLQVDENQLVTKGIDVDVFAEPDLQFDVALRMENATTHQVVSGRNGSIDEYEDVICNLELRARVSPKEVLIRRLALAAEMDPDPAVNTPALCPQKQKSPQLSPQHLALRLSSFRIIPVADETPTLRGSLSIRVPLNLTDRIPDGTRFKGWIGYSGDFSYEAGMRLPEMIGKASGENVGFGLNESTPKTIFTERFFADLAMSNDVIRLPKIQAHYAGGEALLSAVMIAPFAEKMPMTVEKIVTDDVNFPELMRYLDVTENTWVGWEFGHTEIDQVRGTLNPFYIDGGLEAHTHSFAVYDQSFKSPTKQTMVHIDEPTIEGRFRAHTEALEFYDIDLEFEGSKLPVDLVHLGFESWLKVKISEEAQVKLDAIGPLGALEIGGDARLTVDLDGPMSDPPLVAALRVNNLSLGGFEAGDVVADEVHFHPLELAFDKITGKHGKLSYKLPHLDINFEGDASVEVNTTFESENFYLDEFFEVFQLKGDPRFEDLSGSGRVEASVNYLLGGVRDPCEGGRLRVSGATTMGELDLFGEKYNGGRAQFDLDFFDLEAGIRGTRLSVPSIKLKKGSGAIAGALQVESGGRLSGEFIATRVPVSRIDALDTFFSTTDGLITGFGQLEGTIERLGFEARLNIGELTAGKTVLPPSLLKLQLKPSPSKPQSLPNRSACNRPIAALNQGANEGEDPGVLIAQGQLFGGQIQLERVAITQEKKPILRGNARLHQLDLEKISAIIPWLAASENLPQGRFTGSVKVAKAPLDALMLSQGELYLTEGDVTFRGFQVNLNANAQAKMGGGVLETQNLSFEATTPSGETGVFDVEFQLRRPQHITASIKLRESSLDILSTALPGVTHAEGKVAAEVSFDGPFDSIDTLGSFRIIDGKLYLDGISAPITDLNLLVNLNNQGLSIKRGDAEIAGGSLHLTGRAPFSSTGVLADAELNLKTGEISLPLEDDVKFSFQSDLDILIPLAKDNEKLIRIDGEVDLLSGSYQKSMGVTADLASLTGRGKKTEVEAYDAKLDALDLNLLIRSKGELKVVNALLQSEIFIAEPGLRMTGTNQRLGAVGTIEIPKGGRIKLRKNEFEIQRGVVRFVDPLRLTPEVDFTAVTDYRRYDDAGASADGGGTSSGLPTAGNWRIYLHAYGPPDDLKIDLTSEPSLAADDIFLLLTVGLTRAELEQARNSGIGSSVALEALGSLSGAESAVTDAVPIDEFRFGSTWSSRTGRAEPTITIGKRLSQRMRASVTTSLSEANEVRSNIEYKATKNLSIQGSYDNSQSGGSAVGNNLGGDVRWRIEFE